MATTAPPVALEARALTKRFGETLALDRLDLAIQPGEAVCLLGANGAGKTTTLNLFLGFLEPTEGQAVVAGRVVSRDPAAARAELGYVAEVVALYPSLSGAENFAFFHALSGRPALNRDERDTLLGSLTFPLASIDRPVANYSKGMRQKLALAIALAKGAGAILLDEPLSGLDPKAANDLVGVLRQLASDGVALLLSTHDLPRAREVADWVGIMANGRLLDRRRASGLTANQLEEIYLDHMAERVR